LSVSLGGLDTLVFTGGIGEHAEPVRSRILDRLGHIGSFIVKIVAAEEERVIAQHACQLIS